MRLSRCLPLAVALATAIAVSAPASAVVYSESAAGAGETLATAENTFSGESATLDGILGTLDVVTLVNQAPRTQVDLYRIYIPDAATFSARTVSGNPDDTALFLFDSSGFGIYTNDDTFSDLLSFLPTGSVFAPSFYYLAVAIGGYVARDLSGANLFFTGLFTDVLAGDPAAGPLASFDATFASFNEQPLSYSIAFTGAQVAAIPEPETVLLMLAGLAGLVARARSARVRKETV